MKTQNEIINQVFFDLGFDADVHNAAIQVRASFFAPSNASLEKNYTRKDRVEFAKKVQEILKAN